MKKQAPFVIANWKLNGGIDLTCTSVASMLNRKFEARIGIAPPYVYIGDMVSFLRNSDIMVGSQNVSKFASGAFTGETSAQMLSEVGCQFCLIGHSERRQVFLENDNSCHTKMEKALDNNLIPVLCVGENLQQYELGLTNDILYRQLHQSLPDLNLEGKELCIAYEPVWAIGTGKAATADQVQKVHSFIYQELVEILGTERANKVHILYGGSVNKDNVEELLSTPHVDGVLVGGASLDPEHFAEICALANKSAQ
ncbi:triose-phosphate isomerase [Gilvimarinus agarilyticus]|uniref:triose-phosphate isomerase n=1 Tax=unclassified Gilvimarinus TaxID=2642066 RepID=UPI001C0A632B|nr:MULTISPECIES: triose-phosphate isomerase [unclassified Gilvimarinus]MBU2886513.1 triose-phosphate isomerase [Gilvimarinus agarilyticus]MDO6571181.1 triose-phosphate isomerase [Gilvimarinus sp. 2_MG-2023]MDO6746438.1 triose-phosphate isomerase [Gilvimarinus sp. 1_MG-2023]